MNCYLLDALLRTKWRSRGEISTLRFYPAVDAEGPRCILANPPHDDTPDPIRNMTVNITNGAILYDCGSTTFACRPRDPVRPGSVLGVLALVADNRDLLDPLEDWAIITGDQIINVAGPGEVMAQMIPVDAFGQVFGSDRDTNPEHYQPASGPTAATRQFPVILDGRDGPLLVMRGHLDWSEDLPEAAVGMNSNPARVVGRASLVDARAGEAARAAAPDVSLAPAPTDTVHTGGLTDQLAGMYPYYVLGALMGTQWDGHPEARNDGAMWNPAIEVFYEPRFREDGSMVYPVNRAAVSIIEPGIGVRVCDDHVEVTGPGFGQVTSYWDLPESNHPPIGAVILWTRNWQDNPSGPSPLYLAYPVYSIGELEIDGEVVPMIPADDLESCFNMWGTNAQELPFGDLIPTGIGGVPCCPLYIARLAGREILVQAPMCLDDPDDPTGYLHRVTLTDPESEKLIRDALDENPILVTMGRHPPIAGRTPRPEAQAQVPEPTAPDAPESRVTTAPDGAEAPGGISLLDDEPPAQTTERPETGGEAPVTEDTVRRLLDALAGNLRAIAGTLDALKRILPAKD